MSGYSYLRQSDLFFLAMYVFTDKIDILIYSAAFNLWICPTKILYNTPTTKASFSIFILNTPFTDCCTCKYSQLLLQVCDLPNYVFVLSFNY